jgi:hypothetical protein
MTQPIVTFGLPAAWQQIYRLERIEIGAVDTQTELWAATGELERLQARAHATARVDASGRRRSVGRPWRR